MNVPVAAAALVLAAERCPRPARRTRRGSTARAPCCWPSTLVALLLPLTEGRAAGWPLWTWVLLAVSRSRRRRSGSWSGGRSGAAATRCCRRAAGSTYRAPRAAADRCRSRSASAASCSCWPWRCSRGCARPGPRGSALAPMGGVLLRGLAARAAAGGPVGRARGDRGRPGPGGRRGRARLTVWRSWPPPRRSRTLARRWSCAGSVRASNCPSSSASCSARCPRPAPVWAAAS